MSDSEIYYFSGTGNSLHVAQELQKRIPQARLIPMVGLLEKEKITTQAETVGLVFPIYLTTMPIPVSKFLAKLDVSSAKYIFAAATRRGTFYTADIELEKLIRQKGKSLASFFILDMVNNSPCGLVPKSFPGFQKMVNGWTEEISEDRVRQLEPAVQEKLDFIKNKVLSQAIHMDERSSWQTLGKRVVSLLMAPTQKTKGNQSIPYYADLTCTGCGTCQQVCPAAKVSIAADGPVWRKEKPCYYCYACFNSCPQQAILIQGRYTQKKGRYLYPGIEPKEIARQKSS